MLNLILLGVKRMLRRMAGDEAGSSLLETIIALVLFGIIGVSFLTALATTSSARLVADEHTTARTLAESQIENIIKKTYAFAYDPVPVADEYAGYTAVVNTDNLRNGNIQKITVTVRHHNRDVTTLESYKVNR